MDAIQIYRNDKFGQIRTSVTDSGEPLFCLSDVCKALDINGGARNVKSRLSQRGVYSINTPTYNQYGAEVIQQLNFITEPNLYKCIFQSRKQDAEAFQDWVCSEVLPSIRKTGSYSVQPQTPQTYLEALEALVASEKEKQRLESERKSLEEKNVKLQPKADFADAAFKSEGRVDIGQAAKILGLPFGRNTLFKKLREDGIFFSDRNEPKQRYVDAGYFILTQMPPIKRKNHPDLIVMKVICEQKGLAFINMKYGSGSNNNTHILTERREQWQQIK